MCKHFSYVSIPINTTLLFYMIPEKLQQWYFCSSVLDLQHFMHEYMCMYLSKCTCILSSYIKLEKICSYFPRNCMINPGVNFWVSIQCGEGPTLFKKYPLCFRRHWWLDFLPFSFFSVLCACPQTYTWVCICICGSIATPMCTYTNVYIYPGKGADRDYGLTVLAMSFRLMKEQSFFYFPVFN